MDETQVTGQGTRLSEKAPWETYGDELDLKLSPELASAVAEYAERRYEADQSSNQSKEELHRQQEINDEIAKEYQWVKEEEYEDVQQRIGQVMHAATFLKKLQEGGINCWYADHPHPDKCKLVVVKKQREAEPKKICWVQRGYMPELSIMRFDEHGAPTSERRRGWRTCLLQSILQDVLTEEQANALFGSPKQTEAFHRYNALLYEWRHNRLEVAAGTEE